MAISVSFNLGSTLDLDAQTVTRWFPVQVADADVNVDVDAHPGFGEYDTRSYPAAAGRAE